MTQKMDAKITKLTVFQFHIRDIEIEVIDFGTSRLVLILIKLADFLNAFI